MLLSLTGTSLAVIGGGHAPPAPALSALFPFTTTPRPADPVVAVRAVSAVDLFEGVDTVRGDLIRVRVVGIRATAPCWQAESLEFARDVLQDEEVRLVVNTTARTPDGRLPAQVLLPQGQDFALTALTAGAALGTAEVDPELLAAETEARASHRGLWANACAPSQTRTSTGDPAISTTTTSPAPRPDDTTAPTSAPTTTTKTTTTTTTQPADVQRRVKPGKLCSPEGAAGVTETDRELTCKRTLTGKLRWAAR